jgi:pimeloyl-ACP methyl ester carboxylesterase
VIAAHPEIQNWFVGGHSLGGTMAAAYADTHPDQVDGIILWASFPADTNDLSDQPELAVTSIYGTLDGLATPEKVLGAAPLFPPSAQFVPIEGGNHAQFGFYGPQSGDNPATITREEQQAQTVNATVATLALSQ